jgi:hypothetical protein
MAQDPPSRRGEHASALARRTARHRGGQGPGSSQPMRRACLGTGQVHCSAQRRAGPRILPADACSMPRHWPGALLGTEPDRAQDLPSRRGRRAPTLVQRSVPERRTGPRILSADADMCARLRVAVTEVGVGGSRPVLFRIVFLHENGVFFS